MKYISKRKKDNAKFTSSGEKEDNRVKKALKPFQRNSKRKAIRKAKPQRKAKEEPEDKAKEEPEDKAKEEPEDKANHAFLGKNRKRQKKEEKEDNAIQKQTVSLNIPKYLNKASYSPKVELEDHNFYSESVQREDSKSTAFSHISKDFSVIASSTSTLNEVLPKLKLDLFNLFNNLNNQIEGFKESLHKQEDKIEKQEDKIEKQKAVIKELTKKVSIHDVFYKSTLKRELINQMLCFICLHYQENIYGYQQKRKRMVKKSKKSSSS